MKVKNRAIIRGKPLDRECYKAKPSRYELGSDDDRILCYGLEDLKYEEPCEMCKQCKAFVRNWEGSKSVL